MAGEQLPLPIPIAAFIDAFRQQFYDWFLTARGHALPDTPGLLQVVQQFNDFTPENDPRGEHDMGTFDWHGSDVFWKIDYFNQELRYVCDPLSPECRRILTILLASEY